MEDQNLNKEVTLSEPTSEITPLSVQRKKSGPKPKQQQEPIAAMVVAADPKAEMKAKIARQRAENSKMVTGKFLFNECPGGRLIFYFREFPGDQLMKYDMIHGSTHTIP